MRKSQRRNQAIMSFLLAAILAVEPAGTVLAAETMESTSQTTQTDTGSDSAGNDSGETGDASADNESGNTGDTSADNDSEGTGGSGAEDSGSAEENGPDTGGSDGTDDPGIDDGKTDGPETGSDPTEDNGGTGDSADPGEMEDGAEELEEAEAPADEEGIEGSEGNEDTEKAEDDTEEAEEGEPSLKDQADCFTELPDEYKLTSKQMESKRELASRLNEISAYEEGVDYVEGQVITFAQTQEEAELIAEAYHAQIVQFDYGVLTLQFGGQGTIKQAMRAAADVEINLPAVWPNYYRYAYGEITEEESVPAGEMQDSVLEDSVQEIAAGQDDLIEIDIEEYEVGADGEIDGTGQPEDSYLDAMGYSDPYLQSTNSYYQYYHTTIGSPYAWAAGYTGQGIKVAVLDTGVADHTDVSATSIYGPGTEDSHGHGTHVAGIIGAKVNGKQGVGVAPDVTLYSGNVLPDGTGTDADIIMAIKAAQEQNVDIINMSLGGLGYNGAFQQTVNDAYEQGIAIFAASGNDGGTNYTYPSCYDHVISVAATDAGNERAGFSNYGNKVDLSAPGVAIWSTGKNGTSYTRMSGTSMACPVAAGEAAVILSGNADVRGKTGKARVNALENVMKSNALSAGSGMGAGITILPKALKLSTAVTKPAAPTIQFKPDDTKTAQTVEVTIQVPGELTIYYTTDGKTPTYKNGLAGTGTVEYTQPFEIKNQAKATVKAIAVNENGVAGAVRSASYTLKPYVTSISISGVRQLAKGKSAQMKAEVLPAYAANKKVTWELYTADGRKIDARLAKDVGVSITTSGKVTATKQAKTGIYTIKVTAKDQGAESTTYQITVNDTVKIDTVRFANESVALRSVTLTLPGENTYDLGEKLDGKCKDGTAAVPSDFKWSSSNNTIATVSNEAGREGEVKLYKSGKVTITALANDSSGKKATCVFTVKQLAAGITIAGNDKVAAGKSLTYKATVTPAYTSNKKVKWKLSEEVAGPGASTELSETQFVEVTAERGREIGVKINASTGRLTTTSKAAAGTYMITATAADGSGQSASKTITIAEGAITGIAFNDKTYGNVSICRKQQVSATKTAVTIYATVKGKEGADLSAYEVTNSNPGIASVSVEEVAGDNSGTATAAGRQTENVIKLTVKATGRAAGKTNITIASTDGSAKRLTCTVTVNNPASGIVIAPAAGKNQYVARGKTLQLKAVVEAENGKVSNKGVIWELYNTKGQKIEGNLILSTGMSITSGGKVKAAVNATTGSYTVKATAKDGSGVTKTYAISVADPATYIRLQDKNGYMSTAYRYTFEQGKSKIVDLSTDAKQGSVAVTSSNPSVVSVSVVAAGKMQIAAYKKGDATITLKAMDGSGLQVKYYFRVK